ncbi:MAG TPA: hypothetical protein VGG10_06790 [Rhizomicrobium sp.]|jgi:hypothetical protein
MATVRWIGSSGDWSTAADWSTGEVPGAGDSVVFPEFKYFTVTLSSGTKIGSLVLQSYGESLQINAPGQKIVVQRDIDNGGNITIDGDGGGGSQIVVDGTLTNSGSFDIGPMYGALSATSTVTVSHLANSGGLNLSGGAEGTSAVARFIDTGDAAPDTLTYGTLRLQGDALLEFTRGKIETIGAGAGIILIGDQARIADAGHTGSNSALTALTSNAGTFGLDNGAKTTDTTASFQNSGTFHLDGGVFSTANGLDFDNSGTLSIAYEAAGGSVLTVGGTLYNTGSLIAGATYEGASPVITVAHLDNTGSLDIEGAQNDASPTPTLFNVTGDAAPATLASGTSTSISGNAVLTFASGEITSVAAGATLTISGAEAQINDAGVAGQNSALTQFAENDGTVTFSNGADLSGFGTLFQNTGTFTVGDGTVLSAHAGFANTGTLNVDDSTSYTGQASSLVVTGTLTNSGVLNITGGGYGYLNPVPPTSVVVGSITPGTVHLEGSIIGANELAELIVRKEAAPKILTAGATFDLTGDTLVQYASGSIDAVARGAGISLDGIQARIADASNPTTSSALTMLSRNSGTLELADGASLGNSAAAFTNAGLYAIAQNTAVTTAAGVDFANNGTFTLDGAGSQGGSSLAVGGTLTNSGTITIGNNGGLANGNNLTATSEVIAAHLANTGTINLFSSEGSANLAFVNDAGDAAPTTLQGQSLNLVGNALLEYGSGGIQAIARGAQITIDGTQAFIADAAKTASNSALAGLTSNTGTLSLSDGATIAKTIASFDNSGRLSLVHQETFHVAGDFQNTGTFIVDRGSPIDGSEGQSVVTVDGTMTNSGKLLVGDKTFGLTGDTTIDLAHLTSTGTIDIASTQSEFVGSLQVQYQATVDDLNDAAPQTLAAGTIELYGNALLEYASGGIAHIAKGATLSLTGDQARIADSTDTTSSSALTGLVSNAGTFTLDNGATVSNGANGFSNSGTLNIDASDADMATAFTVGGHFINSGTIDLAVTNPGSNRGGYIAADSFTNKGIINAVGAGISATGAIVNTGTVHLGNGDAFGGGGLRGDTLLQTSGQIIMNDSFLEATNGTTVTGGVLQGTGMIDYNVTVTGGTFGATGVYHDESSELIIEDGTLTIGSGATFTATLSAADHAASLVAIDGSLQLNGGTLDVGVLDAAHLKKGDSFEVLWTEHMSGTFAKIEYDGMTAAGNTIAIGNGLALKVEYSLQTGNDEINVVVIADPASPRAGHMAVAPDGTVVHHIADDLILHHGGLQHDGLALV